MSSEPFEDGAPPATEQVLAGPVKTQLDGLAAQLQALQDQIDAFIAGRNEAVAERASHHVAAIVAAAEKSAADIRAGAEKDSAAHRERLLAEVEAEVERIRAEALADAARIRTEADAHAARAKEKAILEARAEIQAMCGRLSEDLQAGASTAIARMTDAGITTPTEPGGARPPETSGPPPQAATAVPAGASAMQIANEVEDAVDELQTAAVELEQSLRSLRPIGEDQQRAG